MYTNIGNTIKSIFFLLKIVTYSFLKYIRGTNIWQSVGSYFYGEFIDDKWFQPEKKFDLAQIRYFCTSILYTMAKFLKWLGGGIGWAAGGPIGAILGFALGSMIDGIQSGVYAYEPQTQPNFNKPQTTPNDFILSLLILASAVMKSDSKILKSELDFVKRFLLQQFGTDETERQLLILRELLKKDYDLQQVGLQIKQYMEYPSRLQLMHFLFGLAAADAQVHASELNIITRISGILGISNTDFESIKAMFVKDTTSAYRILEITPDASADELKKAYRRMAIKYHPDKVAHLGDDVQKAANAKFQELNAAYEKIKKERGIV